MLASPGIPVVLPMTPPCRGAEHISHSSWSRLAPRYGATRRHKKGLPPTDGHRAELRLDPEETSLSSISIRALRSQLLGRTQRPIQEGCRSESKQMSRGAQEGMEKQHSAWQQPHWGLPGASGRGGLRSAAMGGRRSLFSLGFLSLMVVQGMEDTSCHGWD